MGLHIDMKHGLRNSVLKGPGTPQNLKFVFSGRGKSHLNKNLRCHKIFKGTFRYLIL